MSATLNRLDNPRYAKLDRWWEENYPQIERWEYAAAAAKATTDLGFSISPWNCKVVASHRKQKLRKVRVSPPRRAPVGRQLTKRVDNLYEQMTVAFRHIADIRQCLYGPGGLAEPVQPAQPGPLVQHEN